MTLRGWLTGVLAVVLTTAAAAPDDDTTLAHRLAAERRSIESRFEREQAACRQAFALNACIDEARARQRQALTAVQMQQRELAERQRLRRAAERQAVVQKRQASVSGRTEPDPSAALSPASAVASRPEIRQDRQPDSRRERATGEAAAQARAAQRAAAARKLQADIQADQERIQKRLERRRTQGKPAVPLPTPPSASAAG